MSVWFGCFAAVVFLPVVRRVIPAAEVWVVVVSCLLLMMFAGWIFHRFFERRYPQFDCKDCGHRWQDAA
jgi:membrane protein implicated in regulation of membrane protease activity